MTEEQVANAVAWKMGRREIGDLVMVGDRVLGVVTEITVDGYEVMKTSGMVTVKADQIGLLFPR